MKQFSSDKYIAFFTMKLISRRFFEANFCLVREKLQEHALQLHKKWFILDGEYFNCMNIFIAKRKSFSTRRKLLFAKRRIFSLGRCIFTFCSSAVLEIISMAWICLSLSCHYMSIIIKYDQSDLFPVSDFRLVLQTDGNETMLVTTKDRGIKRLLSKWEFIRAGILHNYYNNKFDEKKRVGNLHE